MKQLIVLIASLLLVVQCTTQEKTEWIDVTPGPNLEGWTIVNIPPDQPLNPVQQWSVTGDKIVRCSGQGGHEWLRYDLEQFSDCVFHAEWRFLKLDKPAKYNSGVYVRNNADGTIWHQVQTGDASGGYLFGKTLRNGEIVRQSLRDKMESSPVKPAGEWNRFDITCSGAAITVVVNGVPTVTWNDLQVRSGYVGLEAEGYAVEFRNLRVKKIK